MSRICVIGDVHLANHKRFGGRVNTYGCNERAVMITDAIDRALRACITDRTKKHTVIFAGDFFDGLRPEPTLIDAALRVLSDHGGKNIEFHFLLGNHEYSASAIDSHTIGVLRNAENCFVHLTATACDGVLYLPFKPAYTEQMLRDDLHGQITQYDVVVSHFGIVGDKTPPWLRDQPGAFPATLLESLCDFHSITKWYSGDWHNFTKHSKRVCQIGALVPTGFNNPGFDYGFVAVYDTDTGAQKFISVTGPRFITAASIDEYNDEVENNPDARPLYCQMTVPADSIREVTAAVDGMTIEVLPDTAEQRAAIDSAIQATKNVASMSEKVTAFVSAIPIPTGVSRDEVLTLTLEYLGA